MKKILLVCFVVWGLASCTASRRPVASAGTLHSNQLVFWQELQKLCGQAYQGTVVQAPATDTTFKNKTLLIHVRDCGTDRVRIPLVVGTDLSRTWVLSRRAGDLLLKHDHRHADGTPDRITMYGGHTTNHGTTTTQYFPADGETTSLLPIAGGNIWWIELRPGESLTYNLRAVATDRLFSIRFDLTQPVAAPPAPWGWKD
jgi:hypothetical protein